MSGVPRFVPRFIFNDDGGASRVPGRPIHTAEEFLSIRARGLETTPVDTISFCTTAGTFGRFYHRTRIGEIADDRHDRYENSVIPDLLRAGTDPLEVMAGFAHAHGRRIMWSLRMNDTHDGGNPLLVSRLKAEHPEFLLGTPEQPPAFGMWSAVDYGEQRIRELAVAIVDEVLAGYDVDGVELDFFRHPVFFRRTAAGEKAGAAEIQAMTGLVRTIRAGVTGAAARRGSPTALAAVLPDSVPYCNALGLDVEGWLREGLIDLLLVTGYFRLNPWEESVGLARRYGVPVYPCLQEPRLLDREGLRLRSSLPACRARSLGALSAGMDGVCVYNLFDTSSPVFQDLHDRSALLGRHLAFFSSCRGIGRPAGRPFPYRDFMRIPTLSPDWPAPLGRPPADRARVVLSLPGALATHLAAEPRLLRLWLRTRGATARDLEATWNGVSLALDGRSPGPALADMRAGREAASVSHAQGECWLAAPIDPRDLRAGDNEVKVGPGAVALEGAMLLDVLLEAGPLR